MNVIQITFEQQGVNMRRLECRNENWNCNEKKRNRGSGGDGIQHWVRRESENLSRGGSAPGAFALAYNGRRCPDGRSQKRSASFAPRKTDAINTQRSPRPALSRMNIVIGSANGPSRGRALPSFLERERISLTSCARARQNNKRANKTWAIRSFAPRHAIMSWRQTVEKKARAIRSKCLYLSIKSA